MPGLPNAKGVYGHTSFLLDDKTVVIVGGFHGTVTNDVIAYSIPIEFVPDATVTCSSYVTKVRYSVHSNFNYFEMLVETLFLS